MEVRAVMPGTKIRLGWIPEEENISEKLRATVRRVLMERGEL